jgi:hypothetical protein
MDQENTTDCFKKFICKFCKVELSYGYDKNDMLHCQICHNVWDGHAQCNCYLYNDDNLDDVKEIQ